MARGGKRDGAGRPKGISTKILERQAGAAGMCEELGGDAGWKRIYALAERKKDYRTMLEIMKYWTDKRDGKAPQAINLTGKDVPSIHIQLDPPTPEIVVADKPALDDQERKPSTPKLSTPPTVVHSTAANSGSPAPETYTPDREKLRQALADVNKGFRGSQPGNAPMPGWAANR